MSERWLSTSGPRRSGAKLRASRLAGQQSGLISCAQLKAIGVGDATIARWLEDAYLPGSDEVVAAVRAMLISPVGSA